MCSLEGVARSVTVIIEGNGYGSSSSNPERSVYISHSTNTFRKGTNTTLLSPIYG